MYKVKVFCNTGFNNFNIPLSPAVLESAASAVYNMNSVDVLQNYHLSSIAVSDGSTNLWDKLKNADYCNVGDFYYHVYSVQMTSPDVCVMYLSPSYLLSANPTKTLKSVGGVVTRRSFPANADFKASTIPDPLMIPQEPLKLIVGNFLFSGVETSETTFVESLVDLGKLTRYVNEQYDNANDETLLGILFKSTEKALDDTMDIKLNLKPDSVVVPYVPSSFKNESQTVFYSRNTDGVQKRIPSNGIQIYDTKEVQEGIALSRSLGIESAIIKSYSIPDDYITVTKGEMGRISSITGKNGKSSDYVGGGLFIRYGSGVKNRKVFTGEFNKFGLMTASGSKAEFLPEDIADSENEMPVVQMQVDPRPEGKPYFRFEKYKGSTNNLGFWLNAVSGAPWSNVPLVYTQQSGEYFVQEQHNLNVRNFQNALDQNYTNLIGSNAGNFIGGISNGLGFVLSKDPKHPIHETSSKVSSGLGLIGNGVQYAIDNTNYMIQKDTIYNQKEAELMQYTKNTLFNVPDIHFPINASLLRDFIGNGVLVYRLEYSTNDLKRIDKLLTMYGYACSEPFDYAMVSTNPNFNYLEISAPQITSTLPSWWINGIQNELSNGVRIWSVKPDPSYYG